MQVMQVSSATTRWTRSAAPFRCSGGAAPFDWSGSNRYAAAMTELTYRAAGVDISAGDELVERIKPLATRTQIPEALGRLGGFAALCRVPSGLQDPVLVAGTDGVGTKLKLAQLADRHATVGIDLVAMCVNDVLTTGARPLFFLDYFATGKLEVEQAAQVVQGIAEGCEQAGCALLGGETAELPDMLGRDDYDLAGFAVGVVERERILTGQEVAPGDVILGLGSDGLHSNGYSLARKALLEEDALPGQAALPLYEPQPELGEPLIDALLRPTRIYAKACAAMLEAGYVRAMAHITGGGLPVNLRRVLPAGLSARVHPQRWPRPKIFDLIARRGQIEDAEMYRVFNMGVGLVVVVERGHQDAVRAAACAQGEAVYTIGTIETLENASAPACVRIVVEA